MTDHCQGWNFWSGGVKSLRNLLPQNNIDLLSKTTILQPLERDLRVCKKKKNEQHLFNRIH